MNDFCRIFVGLGLLVSACSGSSNGMGSPGTTGGTSGQGGTGGGGATGADAAGGGPASKFDYSIWVLQLPIGSGSSPMSVSSDSLSGGFSNAYFYRAADGGQIFMDPATGITTPGSQHCRTEMRESNSRGGEAAWTSTGTNTMTVSGKILQAGNGSGSTVTIGQLFIGTDSIPLIELEYSSGRGGFQILYEEAKSTGMTINLNTPVALNSRYTFTLALSQGVLTIRIDGKVVYTRTPDATTLAKQFYFKYGNYDQTTSAGSISETPYSVVEVYSVDVVHN